jgi:arylformamidase
VTTARRYLGYTGAELDALYEAPRQVPDVSVYLDRFEAASAAARERYDGRIDVAYGDHPRERLDAFHAASADAPAVLFFHGGYWRASSKERYSFLADGAVALGATLIAVEYALIPTVTMSELLDQCRRAVAFVHAHAADLGCDGSRLHLTGHSAGGHIVAMLFATDWERWGVAPQAIRGGLALSGLFDLEPIRETYLQETLGLTDEDVLRNSPARLGPRVSAPLHVSVGGDEGAEFIRQARVMQVQWESRSSPIETAILDGRNHYSLVESLAEPAGELCQVLRRHMDDDRSEGR